MPSIKVADIKVSDRFREDFGDIKELANSIKKYGLLQPIIIDREFQLIAGERRFRAHKELGLEEIEVTFYEDLDSLLAKEVELEENLRRKNFTWEEEVKAKAQLDRIKRERYGSTVTKNKEGWSLRDTAKELHQSLGSVAMDIQLAKGLELYPELAKEKSKSAAYNRLKSIRERDLREALVRKEQEMNLSDVKLDRILVNADALEIASGIQSNSIDLIWTDPPWGIDVNTTEAGKNSFEGYYDDSLEAIQDLLSKLYPQLYRILKPKTHMYVVFPMEYHRWHVDQLEDAGFLVDPTPLIGDKESKGAMTTAYRYSDSYSAVLFCQKKPLRELNNGPGQAKVFPFRRVPPEQRYHPAENPVEPIMKHIENSSEPGDLIFEPFVGGGSTIEAALRCNRRVFGCELDPAHYSKAKERILKYLASLVN